MAEIAFAEWTQNGLLRQPRFEGLRTDKVPRDCCRERPQGAGADVAVAEAPARAAAVAKEGSHGAPGAGLPGGAGRHASRCGSTPLPGGRTSPSGSRLVG